jgi:hypothetical protein
MTYLAKLAASACIAWLCVWDALVEGWNNTKR